MAIRGDIYREIESLLRAHGASLERSKTHHVYRFPDGNIWVVPSSPQQEGGLRKNLAQLRKRLGVEGVKHSSNREYRRRGERAKVEIKVERARSVLTLAEQLRAIMQPVAVRAYKPVPCSSAMYLERFYATPATSVIRGLLRRLGR